MASPSLRSRLATAAHIFSARLWIGLAIAVAGACLARPHTLWGAWEKLGHSISLLFIFGGLALRWWGSATAGAHTHGGTIEATQLATTGPYAHVRNPIYLGSIILGLGMVGLIGDAWLLPLWAAAFTFLYSIIVPAEERFLRGRFGSPYELYCRAVPRFLPRLRRWNGGCGQRACTILLWHVFRGEACIVGVLIFIYAAVEYAARLRATD